MSDYINKDFVCCFETADGKAYTGASVHPFAVTETGYVYSVVTGVRIKPYYGDGGVAKFRTQYTENGAVVRNSIRYDRLYGEAFLPKMSAELTILQTRDGKRSSFYPLTRKLLDEHGLYWSRRSSRLAGTTKKHRGNLYVLDIVTHKLVITDTAKFRAFVLDDEDGAASIFSASMTKKNRAQKVQSAYYKYSLLGYRFYIWPRKENLVKPGDVLRVAEEFRNTKSRGNLLQLNLATRTIACVKKPGSTKCCGQYRHIDSKNEILTAGSGYFPSKLDKIKVTVTDELQRGIVTKKRKYASTYTPITLNGIWF